MNDPPVAVRRHGLGFLTAEDTAFTTADVTANDSDVDHPVVPSSVTVVSSVTDGGLVNDGDGTFTYTPDPDFFGLDSFTYTITDPAGAVSAPATVSLGVVPTYDPPVANDDTLTVDQGASATTIDLRLNDSNPDGGPLTIVSVTRTGRTGPSSTTATARSPTPTTARPRSAIRSRTRSRTSPEPRTAPPSWSPISLASPGTPSHR